MAHPIHFSPLAARVRGQRERDRIARRLKFILRCEVLQESEIDDETFCVLLSEAVEDLGLRKERISEALEINLASIYRWLSLKSMPLLFARPKLLMKIAALVRREIDEAEPRMIDDRRHGQSVAASSLSVEAGRFLTPPGPRTFVVDAPAELIALDGPFRRPEQDRRPTFAAFAWRGVGEFELMPNAAVTEAWVYFATPGVSYYAPEKKRFVPIRLEEGVGRVQLFAATDRKKGALPAIRLRTTRDSLASGLLVLVSPDGIPYDVEQDEKGPARAVIHPLKHDGAAINALPSLGIDVPLAPEMVGEAHHLVEIPASGVDDPHEPFNHMKSLALGNFDLYVDRRHQRVLEELRKSAGRGSNSQAALEPFAVSPRIIVFDERSERSSDNAVYICRHKGGEVIIPLYGAVDAHLFDSEAELPNGHQLHLGEEFQLSEAIGPADLYEPFMLLGPEHGLGGVHGALVLNPDRVFHGFTALTRCAGFLALTVGNVAMSGAWQSRSVVGQLDRSRGVGSR